MNRTAILALSLLCLSTGMAFAEGDASGPFGVPQSTNSLPQGFLAGTAQYSAEQAIDRYLAVHGKGTVTDTDMLIGSAPSIAALQAHG